MSDSSDVSDSSETSGDSGRFPSDVAENVQTLAAGQGGHASREQLIAAGVPRRTIDRWIASKRLIVVYRGVYALGHLQSNPISAAHAALLAGGDNSALAGTCALVLWGIWRRWPKPLEIVTAVDRRPSGLTVHLSTTLLTRDIATVQGLRVTSAARTLLDTAQRLTATQLTRAVNDLRLRHQLTLGQLADVLERNPSHPAVTLLAPHLEFAQDEPTRSVLEDRFLPLLRKHGLPTPRINIDVAGARIDAHFPDHGLIVELDGWGTHKFKNKFLSDRRQDFNILLATGITTVRIPYDDVNDPTVVKLKQLLAQRAGPAREGTGPARDGTRPTSESPARTSESPGDRL
jgi:very-short-patch-repair endonuclease